MKTKEKLTSRQLINIMMLSFASVTVYELCYMHLYYYDTLLEALGMTNTQFGICTSAFGAISVVAYFFGGVLADKFSAKKLLYIALFINAGTGVYFSTFPNYYIVIGLYIIWGITTSMMFWSASIKVCTSLGGSEVQGRLLGFFEGAKGFLPLLYSMPILWIFNAIGGGLGGIRTVILIYAGLSLLGGICAMLIKIPEHEDVIETQEVSKQLLTELKIAAKIPEVWLLGFAIFCNYSIILTQRYVAPFFTEVFVASVTIAAIVGYIRNYAIGIFGAPLGGILADKIGSCAKTFKYSFIGLILGCIAFTFMPYKPEYIILGVAVMAFINIFIYINRGIYFGIVDEVNVPDKVRGTTIGLVSFIAFSPEAFLGIIIGQILDKNPGQLGYQMVFGMSIIFAVIGFILCTILYKRVIKIKINK